MGLQICVALLALQTAAVDAAATSVQKSETLILEALMRHLAREYCASDVCYFSVGKERPSELLVRLVASQRLIPVPTGGFTPQNRPKAYQWLLDVGPVRMQPDGTALVGGGVGRIGGPLFTTCAYLLRPAESGWRVVPKETSCAII